MTKNTYNVLTSKRETFLNLLSRFQNLPDTIKLDEVIAANYELCDYEFMELLRIETNNCINEGADLEAKQYQVSYFKR